MSLPDKAIMLCNDEKSQMQALDRTQPVLPMRPGSPEHHTHEYVRHGTTTSLFAALDIKTGVVIGACHRKHRHQAFIRFLNSVDEGIRETVDLPEPEPAAVDASMPLVRVFLEATEGYFLLTNQFFRFIVLTHPVTLGILAGMGMGMGMGSSYPVFRGPTGICLLILGVWCLMPLSRCIAQSESPRLEGVRAWLEGELAEGFSLDEIAPAHIVLWVGRSVPDEANARMRYNDLARRVAGRPEHPDRAELESLRAALFGETGSTMIELFIAGARAVRESDTFSVPGSDAWFHDTVVTDDLAWSMSASQVMLIDPDRGFPRNSNFAGLPETVWQMCGFLVDGGLHLAAKEGGVVSSLRFEGNRAWAEVIAAEGTLRCRFEIEWDADTGTGMVLSQDMYDIGSGTRIGDWRVLGWGYNESLGQRTPKSWLVGSRTLPVAVEWRVDTAERMPAREVKELLNPPSVGSPDPIRGLSPLLVDYRHDMRGRVGALIPGTLIPEGRLPISQRFALTRWLVAGGAATVIALLILARVYRGRGFQQKPTA